MPIKILMPALSPTMEHGNVAKWVKKEGEIVKAGEVIVEIETDKATMEVEAVEEGVLAKIIIAEGAQEIPVNTLIAVLLEEGETADSLEEFIQHLAEPNTTKSASMIKVESAATIDSDLIQKPAFKPINTSSITSNKNTRIFASPLAKRVAAIEGISLASLTGTGPHGRIIKADILSAAKQVETKSMFIRNNEEYTSIANNNMRKIIAKRLLASKVSVPHFYLSIECMMDAVLTARAELNVSFGDNKSKKLSVNDFVIMASAKALRDVPQVNASWSDEAIMLYNNVDISIAVAIDGGLITPVIRNADHKTIISISAEMKDLAKRARESRLKPEEYQGGGLSISNLGMYGVKNFHAIINPPQACILAIGMSSKRAVIVNDKIAIHTMMDVNLSCDHRVINGAVGATFLAAFKKYIESPILMFI